MAQYTQTYKGEQYEFTTDNGDTYRIEHKDGNEFIVWVMDKKPFTLPQTKSTFEDAKDYAEGWFDL